MNKFYVVAPLVSVAVFAAIYRPYQRDFDDRVANEAQRIRAAAEARTAQQLAAQVAAQKAAAIAMEQRARERTERETRETAQRTAHTEAEQRKIEAQARTNTLRADLTRVRRERDDETATVKLLEQKKRMLQQEQALLAAQLYQAETGRRAFLDVTEKIEAQAHVPPTLRPDSSSSRTLNARRTP